MRTMRFLSLFTVLCLCAALGQAQVADPLKPPANVDGKAPPVPGVPDDVSMSPARRLEQLQKALSRPPGPKADPANVKLRLDQIIVDATSLAESTDGPLEMTARSIQLQALQSRINRWPDDPQNDLLLMQMEKSAEALAQLNQPDAGAIGDFWLLSAQLAQDNRRPWPAGEKTRRVRKSLGEYVLKYPDAPPTAAVKKMLERLPAERSAQSARNTPTPPATKAGDPAPSAPSGGAPIDEAFELGPRQIDASGVIRYPIRSRYQPDANWLFIMEPRDLPPPEERRFLYILPVEKGEEQAWGDPLEEIRKLNLHNKLKLIVVMPTFSQTPWYADHPTDPAIRQERYLARAVVPAVEQIYQAKEPKRLLVGFSKSGFGALNMLLRYPDMFTAAAAWDAPLMKQAPDQFGMGPIFGTQANFDRYRLDRQFRDRARIFSRDNRIVLMGYDHFRDDMQRMHNLLEQLNIQHVWEDGPQRRHHWQSGWLGEAIEAVVELGQRE